MLASWELGNPELGVLMLGLFVVFIMFGFPIAFTLMALGFGFGYFAMGDIVFALVVQRAYSVMTNDTLVAIPLFVFMGYIIERANILDRLFHSIQIAVGGLPGSLAIATLVTCAMFATATGIVGAVVTLMGLLAFPAMLRAGYDIRLSAGVVCAGGCLGILIPPSVMLILYGATAGVSVPKLYAGALFPGLMLAGLYILYVLVRCALNPSLAPKIPAENRRYPLVKIVWSLGTSFFPLAVLMLSVLGAIFFGIATPTEAAAVGALGSLLLAAAYRSLTFGKLKESVILTARTSAMVCWLFVGSFIFSSIFAFLGGHQPIEQFVTHLNLSPFWFLIMTQVIIFVLGWPLEWTEIVVIFVPIFLPLLDNFGIDPVFFGVLIALNIQTSFLSPPVAMAPFYLKGIAPPHVNINDIFAGVMPFLLLVIVAMAMFYTFPEIGLWLPRYLYG
ncbi:TRAP transporter large permease [Microvirga lotononidis]|uniref:TRAP transporter large permease protein n=1 Tax=Microvirga lotononidis TaxID=864069 RepID=I4YU10_9HYPH|nr:TRAP transporter large permease subunit [Microvirga lotononidis]EIM27452.1 TRAP transporter, DctM subunit [Microvirga lotononidis]WQO28392.1 TRAP transporter large permease subunit [Microvirga lotononidis]